MPSKTIGHFKKKREGKQTKSLIKWEKNNDFTLFNSSDYTRRQLSDVSILLKRRKCEPRILYPLKLTFKYKYNKGKTVVNI